MGAHVFNRLFPCPAFVVDPRIHYQPHCPKQLRIQAAQLAVGIILIHTNFARQFLGIQRPAFSICGKGQHSAEDGNTLQFLSNGNLKMMSWNPFVIGKGLHTKLVYLIHIAQVGKENPRPPTTQRAHLIISASRCLFSKFRHALHFQDGFRPHRKIGVQRGIHLIQYALIFTQAGCPPLICVGIEKTLFFTQFIQFSGRVFNVCISQPLKDGPHLSLNPLNLAQPDFVHLCRGIVCSGIAA